MKRRFVIGISVVLGAVIIYSLGTIGIVYAKNAAATIVQNHFRWRNDDGSQTTATWKAAEDTNPSGVQAFNTNFRLRIATTETNSASPAASVAPRLEYKAGTACSGTGWTTITTSTSNAFALSASSNFTDGAATTQQLSSGGGGFGFSAGKILETTNPPSAVSLSKADTEHEWSLVATSNATPGTTYAFRVTNNGTAYNTYSVCPQITMNSAPNAPTYTFPSNGFTLPVHQSGFMSFIMAATDPNSDNLGYAFNIYSDSGCSSSLFEFDQSVSSSGWINTNASCTNSPTSCYTSGSNSTYSLQVLTLDPDTQYWWNGRAQDPDGTGTYGSSGSCWSFTTGPDTSSEDTVVTSVSIDADAASVTLTENTTTTVSCVAEVTDSNGYADIDSVTANLFRTTYGTSSAETNNSFYQLSGDTECVPSDGDLASETYTCDFDVYYYADATDAGSDYEATNWTCEVIPYDGDGAGTSDSDTIEMDSLVALNVTSSIDYGTTNPNTDTGSTNQQTTVTNTGNRSLDVQLSGTDMASGGDTLDVGQQEYSATSFTYGAGTSLTSSPVTLILSLLQPTSGTAPVTDLVYWGIGIPNGTPSGTYSGTNTFTATAD